MLYGETQTGSKGMKTLAAGVHTGVPKFRSFVSADNTTTITAASTAAGALTLTEFFPSGHVFKAGRFFNFGDNVTIVDITVGGATGAIDIIKLELEEFTETPAE